MTKVWQGDWRARLFGAVAGLGYGSLREIARANPKATFEELARMVGSDVAAVQVEEVLKQEAGESGLDEFASDSLVRCLREFLPNGWPESGVQDFHFVQAFAVWGSLLGARYEAQARAVLSAFQGARLSRGWLPADSSDEAIVKVFEGVSFARGGAPT